MGRAAERGDPRAHYSLGTWYLHGEYGYREDPARAVPHLTDAAGGGVAEAMYDLGVMFDEGNGVEADQRAAFVWYPTRSGSMRSSLRRA